jgi:WD40 repeat protein
MSERVSALLVNSRDSGFVGSERGTVAAFRVEGDAVERRYAGLEDGEVRSLALSADGTILMASADDGRVVVWDRQTREPIARWEERSAVVQGAIRVRGQYVTLSGNGECKVWREASDGKLEATPVRGEDGEPIGCDAFGMLEGSLVLLDGFEWIRWDIAGETVIDRAEPVQGTRLLHPDGLIGLTRNGRYYFVYWDEFALYDIPARHDVRRSWFLEAMSSAAIAEDGATTALGGKDGSILFMDSKWKVTAQYDGKVKIRTMAFSDDGNALSFLDAGGGGGAVSAKDGKLLVSGEDLAFLIQA